MMTHHFAMTSSLLIKILKIDKFGVFSSDIDFKTKMDIFRDDISLIINQCHLQATEGSLRRTRSVRQPRSASKQSALVVYKRASLACAALLADTLCPPEAPFGHLGSNWLLNSKADSISKYVCPWTSKLNGQSTLF